MILDLLKTLKKKKNIYLYIASSKIAAKISLFVLYFHALNFIALKKIKYFY